MQAKTYSRSIEPIFFGLAIGLCLQHLTAFCAPAENRRITVAVVVGLQDREPTVWEGKFTTTNCRLLEADGWRFTGDDYATAADYRIKTRPFIGRFATRDPRFDMSKAPITANGFILTLGVEGGNASLQIGTPKGEIGVPLANFGYGSARRVLDGHAEIRRVPNYSTVVLSPNEESFPSAARAKEGVAASYVALSHGPGFDAPFKLPGDPGPRAVGKKKRKDAATRGPSAAEDVKMPDDFAFLTAPCGGDQVMFTCQKDGIWSAPEAVTDPGQRVLGTATAVDGEGRTWVFWAARKEQNWDVFGRSRLDGKWSAPITISTAPGSDLFPRAATESGGRVWVTWQSLGETGGDILAAVQKGEGFSPPELIAADPANEWDPAIATSSDGRIAIAWDTYANGHYDVMVRLLANGKWEEPVPVTRGPLGEARPDLAFDTRNRLWITYEVAPENWGKDYGPYDRSPSRTALYQERSIGLRVFDAGRWLEPKSQPSSAFPTLGGRRQKPAADVKKQRHLIAQPRITVGEDGRIWISARAKIRQFEAGTGDTWVEYLTCLDGEKWRSAFPVPGTDDHLHQTAALLPSRKSGVSMVAVSDGRFRAAARMNLPQIYVRRSPDSPPATTRPNPQYADPIFNQEIYFVETGTVAIPDAETELVAATEDAIAPPAPELAQEASNVKAIRGYRAEIGGKSHRIARGEFHRHTELSGDGGSDGSIFDMWRYGLDMASHDWIGNGDHDNGSREYSWWITQKTTSAYTIPGTFYPVWSYERSNNYPDGHRNAVFVREGIRPLPRLRGGLGKAMDDLAPDAPRPHSPDSLMFFKYLEQLDGICASHTSGTDMGTDWRDFGGKVEPVVEIYQGERNSYERPGGPRASSDAYSIGGFRPLGFVSLALKKGYRLGFESSSDHVSTHMSYCCVYVEKPTREDVVQGLRKRHVYGATDNIIADVRCGDYFMGDEFTIGQPPTIRVKLLGTAPFAEIIIVRDDEIVYSSNPDASDVQFEWTDSGAKPGATSYYYVRGTQRGETTVKNVKSHAGNNVDVPLNNGEVVWTSPMWITFK